MSNAKEYNKTQEQAKANLADMRERREDAIGGDWEELREELLTPEERAASGLRVAVMIELTRARRERGITQKKLEELSGVRQPIIARMERGTTSPQLDTVLKVLAPLGKRWRWCRWIGVEKTAIHASKKIYLGGFFVIIAGGWIHDILQYLSA